MGVCPFINFSKARLAKCYGSRVTACLLHIQVYGMLVLVMSLIVYGYVLPYKSKVANGAEIVIQLNFLTLLVLEATPLFQETLFYFPAPTGDVNMERSGRQCMDEPPSTNSLSWLLLPFYYAPVVGVVTAVIIYSILCFM